MAQNSEGEVEVSREILGELKRIAANRERQRVVGFHALYLTISWFVWPLSYYKSCLIILATMQLQDYLTSLESIILISYYLPFKWIDMFEREGSIGRALRWDYLGPTVTVITFLQLDSRECPSPVLLNKLISSYKSGRQRSPNITIRRNQTRAQSSCRQGAPVRGLHNRNN